MNSIEYKDKKQSLILQISKHLCLILAKIIIYSKFIRNDDKINPLNIVILPADDTQGGYASGPENLEHSSILPMLI